jgi:hypothetical protein
VYQREERPPPATAKEVACGLTALHERGIGLEGATFGELSPAWEGEIQDRLRQAEAGAFELILGDEVFRAIEADR